MPHTTLDEALKRFDEIRHDVHNDLMFNISSRGLEIVIDFLTKEIPRAYAAGEAAERERSGKKKVIWVEHHDPCCEGEYKSQETLLKERATECEIWLADKTTGVWGDDWNDAPRCCNAGQPYKETVKGLEILTVRLGEPLEPIVRGRSTEASGNTAPSTKGTTG